MQGRGHGFESGGDNLRAERAKKNFWTPHFLASGAGDKILLLFRCLQAASRKIVDGVSVKA